METKMTKKRKMRYFPLVAAICITLFLSVFPNTSMTPVSLEKAYAECTGAVGDDCFVAEPNGCKTAGKIQCIDETDTCVRNGPPAASKPEVLGTLSCFDLADNDCDGLKDFADSDCQTPNEVGLCNGLDDDHDGSIDEDFPGLGDPCTVGVGFCQRSATIVCSGDHTSTVCSATPGSPSTENTPGTGRCVDGIDNDCDGLVDIADSGCQSSELCDGIDNDGDGLVDEDFANLEDPCKNGIGACEKSGVFVCSADHLGTVCNAVPAAAGVEGPIGATCSDGIDNDCDGTTDLADSNCSSADLSVKCALVPVKGKTKPKPGDPSTDCEGKYKVVYSSNAEPDMVSAVILALDVDGHFLGSIPVENNDLVQLASRTGSADFKIYDNGSYIQVFAPVPLLRVTVNTGHSVAVAYASPIPYLDVIAPDGTVVSASEGNVTEVLVAIPQVDPKKLSVKVDGVDILAQMGISPANKFPGGPYTNTVTIGGQPVKIVDLTVRAAPLGSSSANTLTMQIENLRAGGHIILVQGQPITGALPGQVSAVCYIDDIKDTGTVFVFGIEITSPNAGQVTNTVPTPVTGEVRHGRPISGASVQGIPLNVSGQVYTPGDGVSSTDLYVLPFSIHIPQTNLSAPPQLGTFDRGQNELLASAQDDLGNTVYESRRFTIGETVGPQIMSSFLSPSLTSESFDGKRSLSLDAQSLLKLEKFLTDGITKNLENAIVFGISAAGLQDFFQSTCDKANDMLRTKIVEALKGFTKDVPIDMAAMAAKSGNDLPEDICTPTVTVTVTEVAVPGVLNCLVTPEDGQMRITVTLPDISIMLHIEGSCVQYDDLTGLICLAEIIINVDMPATITGVTVPFVITETLALTGGESEPPVIDPGTFVPGAAGAGVEVNCALGVLLDMMDFLSFGLIDIEGEIQTKVQEKLSGLEGVPQDLSEQLKSGGSDPLEIKKIEADECPVEKSGINMDQELVDVQITPAGLTGTISIGLEVPVPDFETGITPEATLTAAPPPEFPVTGAKEVFFVVSDDMFSLLFAAMTLKGDLQAECVPSGLEVIDLLPADCDSLTGSNDAETARNRGKCHGAKGDDCNTLPIAQRPPCNDEQASLSAKNISPDTGILFCGRQDIAPRLLIEDQLSTPDVVEAKIRLNDHRITLVLDREADGQLLTKLSSIPNCSKPGSDPTVDCRWAAACFDMDVATDLTLGMSGAGEPQIIPQAKGISDAAGAQCGGVDDLGDNTLLLSQAGASDPIAIIQANINTLTPLFQADGLTLGGFVNFENTPILIAIETADEPDCMTCQEYIGVTQDIVPQEQESLCDGLDNDGDGKVDEGFRVGSECAKEGESSCSQTGVTACSADQTGTICQ
jgi:hypothetical protein